MKSPDIEIGLLEPEAPAVKDPATPVIHDYDGQVPDFTGPEIDRVHDHLVPSLRNYRIADEVPGASTFVVREQGRITDIFLYRREGRVVTVLSEFIRIDADSVRRFAQHVFATYPGVGKIVYRKANAGAMAGELPRVLPYPYASVPVTEDIVVSLPDSIDAYHGRLGKNMRRNIKRYHATLGEKFPSYTYDVYLADRIAESDLRDIIALNRTRMAGKRIVSRIDEDETRWIVSMAKQCGIVGVARIDGKVCAGAIGFRIRDNYFMHVIAHDPAYNDYSLGILCYYFTICEGIKRGGRHFHLMSGRYEYKFRLGGELRDISRLELYRNRLHWLLDGRHLARQALQNRVRDARLWLLEAERRDDRMSLAAASVMQRLREAKRNGWKALLARPSKG
ncbi:Acetyltransferase (GNAT) domain-containing protein [Noviherbaspirillum humi]|uniref:Acetyltransferase (GNAT) domain-containing protein n=1 Tax=Noviherbaspirillum humi TaxID=1688639 RepID=A0A239FCN2_9BURK|nr:GNAT family N-acetyltransferase [Noviherbaspirillum humi]SNS54686.1 Acetyltransferase (GNAT) domain-containing protein [Noviherbaspirillum humi]